MMRLGLSLAFAACFFHAGTAAAMSRTNSADIVIEEFKTVGAAEQIPHQVSPGDYVWGLCQQIFWPSRLSCHVGCAEAFPLLSPPGQVSNPFNDPNFEGRNACAQNCDENYNNLVTRCTAAGL